MIEYIGDPAAVIDAIERRGVKGSVVHNGLMIREAIIGEVPELLDEGEAEAQAEIAGPSNDEIPF